MNLELLPIFMPSLVAQLAAKENQKGSELSEKEVIAIRDTAEVVMSPIDVYQKVSEQRGYDDIDPENVWEEWQKVRKIVTNLN